VIPSAPSTRHTKGRSRTPRAQTFDPRRLAIDSTANLSSFRTRQYDPSTGSWLQEDHAGLAGGVNLYQYNGNDPNSFGDPFGVCPTSVGGNGATSSYSDCPKGTKGYDMVGRLGSPSVDPVAVFSGALVEVAGDVAAGLVEDFVGGVSPRLRHQHRSTGTLPGVDEVRTYQIERPTYPLTNSKRT
jgi:RHS repeat-associated protein